MLKEVTLTEVLGKPLGNKAMLLKKKSHFYFYLQTHDADFTSGRVNVRLLGGKNRCYIL